MEGEINEALKGEETHTWEQLPMNKWKYHLKTTWRQVFNAQAM